MHRNDSNNYNQQQKMMSIIPVNRNNARLYSICAMTLANALHFGAYELCRSSISSFITSSSIGFVSTITITFVIGCICPCSIIIFYIYRNIYDIYGSQISLRYITMFYAICLSITAIILRYCCRTISLSTSNTTTTNGATIQHCIAQCTIIIIFILKNSFVQLLYSQHWSFLTSVLSSSSTSSTISTSTTTISRSSSSSSPKSSFVSLIQIIFTKYIIIDDYTSIIAGIGSIVATIFGSIITTYIIHLYQPQQQHSNNHSKNNNIHNNTNENYDNNINENYDGLTCLLICSAFLMMITSYCSEEAYRIANMYQFAPTTTIKEPSKHTPTTTTTTISLYQRATILFKRIPLLQILCYEVLLCQGVSSLMSYIYVSYMKQSIPYDNDRASHTGIVYGRINFGSSILQFAILPFILRRKQLIRQCHNQNNNNHNNDSNSCNKKSSDGHCNGSTLNSHHQQYDNWLWLLLPSSLGIASTIMIYITSYKSLTSSSSSSSSSSFVSILLPSYNVSLLNVVTVSFCIMKILEYSLRVALIERVYAVLDDDEGKFFGKEINTLVANRFGKSSSALLLAFMTIQYPTTFLLYAPCILVILCCIWFYISIRLIQLLSLSSTSLYPVTNQDKVK